MVESAIWVKVFPAAPSVGVVSWGVGAGGAETTFVGDGTNGELGKTYKVCRFTANGDFVVSEAGMFEVLLVAGGGGGDGTAYMGPGGGAGQMIPAAAQPMKMWLEPGTYPAVIGAGGAAVANGAWTGYGKKSTFAGLTAAGGAVAGDYATPGKIGACGGGGSSASVQPGGNGLVGGDGEVSEPAPAKGSGGGMGGNAAAGVPGPGIVNYATGTAVEYSKGGMGTRGAATAPVANSGGGGGGGLDGTSTATAGSAGVLVVRFQTV